MENEEPSPEGEAFKPESFAMTDSSGPTPRSGVPGGMYWAFAIGLVVVTALITHAYDNNQTQSRARAYLQSFSSNLQSTLGNILDSASPSSTPVPDISPGLGVDKSFRLDVATFKDDGLGDIAATTRISNVSGADKSGSFTITIFGPDKTTPIATLTGSASGVSASQQVTVDFFSSDKTPSGSFTYSFQTDTEY